VAPPVIANKGINIMISTPREQPEEEKTKESDLAKPTINVMAKFIS
jgi:hypothetical protein